MNSELCRLATGAAALACAIVSSGCSCGETALAGTGAHDDAGGTRRKPDSGRDGSPSDGAALDVYAPQFGVQPRSGSQIAVLGFRSGDAETGAYDPVLRDKKHGVECTIRVAADGKARCLPEGASVYFTDENCTQPIAKDFGTCGNAPPPSYGVEYWDGDSLCQRSKVHAYEIGAPIAAPALVYTQGILGCSGGSPAPGEAFREATATPLADWVEFERETTKVTAELGVSSLRGSDGSFWPQSLVLLTEDVLCEGASQSGPTNRCIPRDRLLRPTPGGTHFADSACQDGLGARCEPNPTLIEGFDPERPLAVPNPCAPRYFPIVGPLFRVGKEIDHSEIYTVQNATCALVPNAAFGPFHYYSAGAPVPFADYPLIGEMLVGTGRLQRVISVAEGGEKLFAVPGVFYDTVSNAYCQPQDVLLDGRIVCVPQKALGYLGAYGFAFSDSQCSNALVNSSYCQALVAATLTMQRIGPSGEQYECRASLHRTTAHVGPVFATEGGANCHPVDSVQLGSTTYDIGEPVEPDALFPPLESFDY